MSQASKHPNRKPSQIQNVPAIKRPSLRTSQATMVNIVYFSNKDGMFLDHGMFKIIKICNEYVFWLTVIDKYIGFFCFF